MKKSLIALAAFAVFATATPAYAAINNNGTVMHIGGTVASYTGANITTGGTYKSITSVLTGDAFSALAMQTVAQSANSFVDVKNNQTYVNTLPSVLSHSGLNITAGAGKKSITAIETGVATSVAEYVTLINASMSLE